MKMNIACRDGTDIPAGVLDISETWDSYIIGARCSFSLHACSAPLMTRLTCSI